jgi:hypothetical protein
MKAVMVFPQTEARMSPHHTDTHQQPRVHRTRGLGDSAGSGPEEVSVGSWLEAAWVGEVGAPLALGKPHASFRIEGFRGFSAVLSA